SAPTPRAAICLCEFPPAAKRSSRLAKSPKHLAPDERRRSYLVWVLALSVPNFLPSGFLMGYASPKPLQLQYEKYNRIAARRIIFEVLAVPGVVRERTR